MAMLRISNLLRVRLQRPRPITDSIFVVKTPFFRIKRWINPRPLLHHGMASQAATTQKISLPHICELYDPNFLDVLLPHKEDIGMKVDDHPRNPMMEALQANTSRTRTWNGAPAFNSTDSATLDAFNGLNSWALYPDLVSLLSASWNEDPSLTLRLIWQLRSIHDGKGETEAFYRYVLQYHSLQKNL